MTATVLAIIPARAGSRGIPQKNIALVAGKPLIAWTIAAAQATPGLHRVIITTNCEKIAAVGRQYGAEVPFLRPEPLALDDTPGIYPILHALRWLEEHEAYKPDYVMCLQPTSPLRNSVDISGAIDLAAEKKADAVVSVTPVLHHPAWVKRVDDSGRLQEFLPPKGGDFQRQNLPPLYALNGAIYLARRQVLMEQETWYTSDTYAWLMPPERSLDVDTPWDLYLAELILRDARG
jgi:CMP-N,N'-diacetyllegionaminic acid synthase